MVLSLENLDARTRELMFKEFELDMGKGVMYLSPRLNDIGAKKYPGLLRQAIIDGNDSTLASNLLGNDCFKSHVQRKTKGGGYTMARIPIDAHQTLAEGEFNRYYIRALCRRALEDQCGDIEVCRVKEVTVPRPESVAKIGQIVDPNKLLEDLRVNVGIDTAFGLPAGPNSGLSIRIKT